MSAPSPPFTAPPPASPTARAGDEAPAPSRRPAESLPPPRRAPDTEGNTSFDGEEFLYHLFRGGELLQDNYVNEAKEELERALAMQPRDIEGQGLLGVVYFRLGMYPRAIDIYEDILRVLPHEITPRINLALCYLKTGQSPLARDALEAAVERAPDHRRAWGYLGIVYERLGELNKALTAFERAGQPSMAERIAQAIERLAAELPATAAPTERLAAPQSAAHTLAEIDQAHAELYPAPPGERASAAPVESTARALGPWIDVAATVPPAGAAPAALSALLERRPLALGPSERWRQLDPQRLLVRVTPSLAVRRYAARLVRARGPLATLELQRQARGQALGGPLGGSQPLVLLEGDAECLVGVERADTLSAWELHQQTLYVREERLVGFSGTLTHEVGRLTREQGAPLPMVQLAGDGVVLVAHHATLHALPLEEADDTAVAADDVIAWVGRLLPRPLPHGEAPGGVHGLVAFSGRGTLLLDLG